MLCWLGLHIPYKTVLTKPLSGENKACCFWCGKAVLRHYDMIICDWNDELEQKAKNEHWARNAL